MRPVRSQQTLSLSSLHLLQPLPVPGRPWHSISMEFIEHLPTSNGLSWWLLTVWTGNVFSFQLRTLVLPRTLQVHCVLKAWHPSPCVLQPRIGIRLSSAPSFEYAYTSRQVTTSQPMVR